ncbi:hypothetical protein HY486_03415 [Candidatus Woesearchaeota archaeon]|nr:hypothetical protein [Candidatus Woesearchaeota archaeon]
MKEIISELTKVRKILSEKLPETYTVTEGKIRTNEQVTSIELTITHQKTKRASTLEISITSSKKYFTMFGEEGYSTRIIWEQEKYSIKEWTKQFSAAECARMIKEQLFDNLLQYTLRTTA